MRAAASRSACDLTTSRVVDVLVRDARHRSPSLALLHDVVIALYDMRMAWHLRDRQSDRSSSARASDRVIAACSAGYEERPRRHKRPCGARPSRRRVFRGI